MISSSAILIALLFLAVQATALATNSNSTIPPDCDEVCNDDATPDMAGCWTMECVKEQLIQSCSVEFEQQPEYIDCSTILSCINMTELQSDYCAGSGYPVPALRKA